MGNEIKKEAINFIGEIQGDYDTALETKDDDLMSQTAMNMYALLTALKNLLKGDIDGI